MSITSCHIIIWEVIKPGLRVTFYIFYTPRGRVTGQYSPLGGPALYVAAAICQNVLWATSCLLILPIKIYKQLILSQSASAGQHIMESPIQSKFYHFPSLYTFIYDCLCGVKAQIFLKLLT